MPDWILDFIFPLRTDEEIVRDLTEQKFLSFLSPELVERTDPPAVALLPFSDRRVRAVLHEAKYHGTDVAFTLLAATLIEYLRDADFFDGLQSTVLVPVPLGRARLASRGYNQVEAVARIAGKALSIPLDTSLLVRTRETTSQVSLAKSERAKNMRGAFLAARPPDPTLTYLLLDDVTTTGATLSAAVTALKEAGVQNIHPIALAH